MQDSEESPLSISRAGKEDGSAWTQYVLCAPAATVGHEWNWRCIIQDAYGHEAIYLIARQEGMIRGILPLIAIKSPILGASLASMPFLDYGGVCADNHDIAKHLVGEAQRLGRASGLPAIELRQTAQLSNLPTPRQDKVTMILDLSEGEAGIWNRLPAKVRNQVRKAEKCGLTTLLGGAELLEEFYQVFLVNMRDLGSPVHGLSFFTSMAAGFGSQMRLRLVRDGDKTVGGLISLHFKDAMLVPWASSLQEYFPKCPNNLLYWHAIQDSCARGFKTFDFGRSSVGSGTYKFKRQWGAKALPLYWYVLSDKDRHGNAVDGSSVKYRLVREIWRHLPVGISATLGPRIRKYLTN
jgi:serine/alanine adding enzyme